jgi:hypothetical protein
LFTVTAGAICTQVSNEEIDSAGNRGFSRTIMSTSGAMRGSPP